MNDLVINHNGTLTTTQDKVSILTDNNELSVQKLIRTYKQDLEEFGNLEFEDELICNSKNKMNSKKVYYLNEQQATLLLTYMKNTKQVREAKKILVKAFYELKSENQRLKHEKYINEISSLNATLISKAKRHQRVVNAYKSNLSQKNNKIVALKQELKNANSSLNYEARYKNAMLERDYYFKKYKDLEEKHKFKEEVTFKVLDKIRSQLDDAYGDISALIPYVWEDNAYFLKQRLDKKRIER
ncbi:Rha family transcriptional regulator [Campylobacter pinnipediorum]|uniref:Rha family transcriptional regulator n=1 Tax=Campylobacter pinnipediorum TaxID=1965231 RepID=UPI0009951ABF|nr:Rha family transcriptional regulator [Campylobacter pinnipediorum]AQW83035.1 phage regulatory protein, Rha family [Campylobacter pinnipediorum subsp. pinnipediorum]